MFAGVQRNLQIHRVGIGHRHHQAGRFNPGQRENLPVRRIGNDHVMTSRPERCHTPPFCARFYDHQTLPVDREHFCNPQADITSAGDQHVFMLRREDLPTGA